MTFDDILEQVLALLKRQGRVSYRALQRRFALDDDYIADVKDELLYVHPVVDDEGRGLVWTGSTEALPTTSAPPTPTPTLTAPPPPDAEREPRSYTPKHLLDCCVLPFALERYRIGSDLPTSVTPGEEGG